MDSLDAVEKVLEEAAEPLHYQEITDRILDQDLWITEGKTPEATINARLAVDIKQKGGKSRFMRTEPGVFALREWGLEEYKPSIGASQASNGQYSFTDAAEVVLDIYADKRPMHYREITERIMEDELVATDGQTPEATLYSMILTEIKRHTERDETPRFVKYGQGMVGLRKWIGDDLIDEIDQHNKAVREKLLSHLRDLSAREFEELSGQLLAEMGFEDTEVTPLGGDKGIDVKGTMVTDFVRTKFAVQVKKWSANVHAPTVQQIRGSLSPHERGMIITTSDFSKGAHEEADRSDAAPVTLINGERLVELMIKHQLWVRREPFELIYLDVT